MRRCSQVRLAKGLAWAGLGTPVELNPFSETNYVTFPSKGWSLCVKPGQLILSVLCGDKLCDIKHLISVWTAWFTHYCTQTIGSLVYLDEPLILRSRHSQETVIISSQGIFNFSSSSFSEINQSTEQSSHQLGWMGGWSPLNPFLWISLRKCICPAPVLCLVYMSSHSQLHGLLVL